MTMAERADPDDKINGQAHSENDQLSDVERPIAEATHNTATIVNNKADKNIEKAPLEPLKREENPFSFKHFLKRDNPSGSTSTSTLRSSSQNPTANSTGARPKVFTAAVNSTPPLTLPLDSYQLKKCKHVTHETRYNDFRQQESSSSNMAAAKTSSVEDITYISDGNSMKNLYRSYSDRDTSYKSPTNSENSFSGHKHIAGRVNSSEFSSVLPDFVQDHIVLEQWYSGFNSPQATNENADGEQSIDYSSLDRGSRQKSFHSNRSRSNVITDNELPSDLMPGQEVPNRRANSMSIPLNLPRNDGMPFDLPRNNSSMGHSDRNPLDLPAMLSLDLTGNVSKDLESRNDYNGMQEVPQILPDFLSDGAIHSDRLADLVQASPEGHGSRRQGPDVDNITDAVSRLSLENDRLRRELDSCRRQVSEQSSQITRLQSELSTSHQNEGQYTTKLASALETVEQNMARSNKRAAEAESTVALLKKQISQLTTEMDILKRENSALHFGSSSTMDNSAHINNVTRLSNELRMAASTAESSLRQLLTGVDNLRVLADALEGSERISEPGDDNFGESEDEGAGPAL